MHGRTILFTIGVCLGILSGHHSMIASESGVEALMLGAVEGMLFWVSRKRDMKGVALSLYLALVAFGFFIGTIRVQLAAERPVFTCDASCVFDGRVTTSPERRDEYQLFAVHALESSDEAYDIQVRSPLYPLVRVGETYSFIGKVSVPAPSYPHGGKSSFDYASYLHTKEIGSEMMFPSMKLIDPEARTTADLLGRWKEDMIQRIVPYVASPASLLATGMLFGDSSLPQNVKESFRVAGLSHIIVLSGFNIAIVISFVLLLFRFLPLILRTSLASLFVIAFVMMVGAHASVIRATLMAFIGLLASALGRQYVAKQALMVSFLAIILYDPYSLLHDISLHLSFLATAGIIYLEPSCSLVLRRYVKHAYLRELFCTTVAAYLATFPYVAHVFGSVSLYALAANVFVLPAVPLMMLVSFGVVMSSFLSSALALGIGFVVSVMGSYILFIARSTAALPFASVAFSGASALLVVLMVCGAGVFLMRNELRDETTETVPGNYLTDVITY